MGGPMKLNRTFRDVSELPTILPLFPLEEALLLPRRPLQLNIFEPRYLEMLDDAISGDRVIGMIQPRGSRKSRARKPPLHQVGCSGRIVQFVETGDGRCIVTLIGIARFRVLHELLVQKSYRRAQVEHSEFAGDLEQGAGEASVDRAGLLAALKDFADARNFSIDWDDVGQASNETLVNSLSMMSPYGSDEKQALLEASDLKGRAEMLVAITQMELARGAAAVNQLH